MGGGGFNAAKGLILQEITELSKFFSFKYIEIMSMKRDWVNFYFCCILIIPSYTQGNVWFPPPFTNMQFPCEPNFSIHFMSINNGLFL